MRRRAHGRDSTVASMSSEHDRILAEAVAPFARGDRASGARPGAEVHRRAHPPRPRRGRPLDGHGHAARLLDQADARRAVVFPLHDPERVPAYRVPNDRVLGWAARPTGGSSPSAGSIPPMIRCREADRCLERGARGIKLHPRAQSFAFADGVADGIFALAEQARVPILIHAGRGMPPIADGLAELALRHPEVVLILAHAGIADQGILASRLAGHPGVLYDTSCFSALDVVALFARVPRRAGRVRLGSALRPSAHRALPRAARCRGGRARRRGAGARARRHRRAPAGRRRAPPATAPACEDAFELSGRLARFYSYGMIAFGSVIADRREPDAALEALDLMAAVTRDPDPGRRPRRSSASVPPWWRPRSSRGCRTGPPRARPAAHVHVPRRHRARGRAPEVRRCPRR